MSFTVTVHVVRDEESDILSVVGTPEEARSAAREHDEALWRSNCQGDPPVGQKRLLAGLEAAGAGWCDVETYQVELPDLEPEPNNSEGRDPQMVEFLAGVVGVVEANSFEHHSLYKEYRAEGKTWKDRGDGYLPTVGWFGGYPVCVSISTAIVSGSKIAFVYPTSLVVHHDLVRDWLAKVMPASARRADGSVNSTDAMNFHNVFPRDTVAEAAEAAGFTIEFLGGNTRAYGRHGADAYVWLTDEQAGSLPETLDEENCMLCGYRADSDSDRPIATLSITPREVFAEADRLIAFFERACRAPCDFDGLENIEALRNIVLLEPEEWQAFADANAEGFAENGITEAEAKEQAESGHLILGGGAAPAMGIMILRPRPATAPAL